jgi:hypothetical protein
MYSFLHSFIHHLFIHSLVHSFILLPFCFCFYAYIPSSFLFLFFLVSPFKDDMSHVYFVGVRNVLG